VWNRIPDAIQDQIIEMALEQSELSPRCPPSAPMAQN
jgi:hypothetical protein